MGTGVFQCFCLAHGSSDSIFDSDSFCFEFKRASLLISAFSNLTALIIAGINMTVRYLNIFLISKIGYNYESQRIRMVMQSILYAQYFNTALLLLLSNANLKNTPLSFLPLREQFADTTTQWYILFGPAVIKTMVFYSVFPYLNLLVFGGLRYFRRFLDSGFSSFFSRRAHRTLKTTVAQYVELYSGPDI